MQTINKINNIGMQLLEYKKQLLKDYPKIVKDSLHLSLEQMAENKVITVDTLEVIKNHKESSKEFKEYLLSKDEFTKTYDELFKEYEEVRKIFNTDIKERNLQDLTTETVVEEESVYVFKNFFIDKNFITEYFGVEDEDLPQLMKKKGFIEKFSTLRLTKVMTDIVKEGEIHSSLVKLDNSLAYFNENRDKYNIDLIIKVDINDLINNNTRKKSLYDIEKIRKLACDSFREKMIC